MVAERGKLGRKRVKVGDKRGKSGPPPPKVGDKEREKWVRGKGKTGW